MNADNNILRACATIPEHRMKVTCEEQITNDLAQALGNELIKKVSIEKEVFPGFETRYRTTKIYVFTPEELTAYRNKIICEWEDQKEILRNLPH